MPKIPHKRNISQFLFSWPVFLWKPLLRLAPSKPLELLELDHLQTRCPSPPYTQPTVTKHWRCTSVGNYLQAIKQSNYLLRSTKFRLFWSQKTYLQQEPHEKVNTHTKHSYSQHRYGSSTTEWQHPRQQSTEFTVQPQETLTNYWPMEWRQGPARCPVTVYHDRPLKMMHHSRYWQSQTAHGQLPRGWTFPDVVAALGFLATK